MAKKARVTKLQSIRTEIIDVKLAETAIQTIDQVVGKTVEEATKIAEAAGKKVRITRTDNSYHIGTAEYSPTRVNLEVEKGIVVRSAIG